MTTAWTPMAVSPVVLPAPTTCRVGGSLVHGPELDVKGDRARQAPAVPVPPPGGVFATYRGGRCAGLRETGSVSERNCRVMLVNEQKQSR
ncbi:hypothetical protein HNR10_002792 [Nocardiopsis aegyptia]|uniref:Uncharacterized protein n=1 Tax=Nocardiopsis aegyptia TaxID=220378 RepID=A0A7Z0ENP1_9ACTN|nr:hypothetical protein [Nocardiopsis aegyptia]